MIASLITFAVVLLSSIRSIRAQAPLPPVYDTVVDSKLYPGVKVSYKAPGICETTPGVKSYSGYIQLPPQSLLEYNVTHNYPINLFFWFFESRKDPVNAPFTIWLNGGGAGTSSMKPLFHGTGPCNVNPDSRTSKLNPWSWNNEANVLYIDQPVQTGFSYDVLTNRANGVGASGNAFQTAQTSGIAARTLWLFTQVFVSEFPAYKTKSNAVSLWATGYGGRWAPSFGAFFMRRAQMKIAKEVPITIDTIGIVNGFVDVAVQQPMFPEFAFNNTYGIKAIDEGTYRGVKSRYNIGCGSALPPCVKIAAETDPENLGAAQGSGNVCNHAGTTCETVYMGYSLLSGRSVTDVTVNNPNPNPDPYFIGYLNSREVQQALGVPRNFTPSNANVAAAFLGYDDYVGGRLEAMGYLLDQGVRVALVYGDRDYSNNWLGGEAVSTAVQFKDSATFKSAGYQKVTVNTSYVGGQVRQVGKLSFTRVYDAGNEAYAYQPETLLKIFQRVMSGKDIASGSVSALEPSYRTTGPSSTWGYRNKTPCPPAPRCYILAPGTCSNLQQSALEGNFTIVKDYVITGYKPNIPQYLDPPYLKNQPKPAGC